MTYDPLRIVTGGTTMENLDKIRRVSRWLELACYAGMVCLPALILLVWIDFDRFGPLLAGSQGVPLHPENIGPMTRVLGFLCSMLPLSVILYGIWRLRKLFANYRQDELFNEANASHLLSFARMLFISVLLTPLAGALTSVVLTLDNPPGQRALVLSIGSEQFATLFIAGVFIAVAWIMREGQRLAAENQEFI